MTRSPTALAPLALLCLALSAPLHAAPPTEPCTPVFSLSDCAGYLEAELLRNHPLLFSRKEGTLKLSLMDGSVRQFNDVPLNDAEDNTEQHVSYALLQYFPAIGYVLIDASYWEGGTYYLVDIKTGATTDVGGLVALSPDKRRFAVANVDIEAEYTPNLLAVYQITPDGLVNEFIETPDKWGASDIEWEDNEVVRFSRNYWGTSAIEKKTQRLRLVASEPEPAWKME